MATCGVANTVVQGQLKLNHRIFVFDKITRKLRCDLVSRQVVTKILQKIAEYMNGDKAVMSLLGRIWTHI